HGGVVTRIEVIEERRASESRVVGARLDLQERGGTASGVPIVVTRRRIICLILAPAWRDGHQHDGASNPDETSGSAHRSLHVPGHPATTEGTAMNIKHPSHYPSHV